MRITLALLIALVVGQPNRLTDVAGRAAVARRHAQPRAKEFCVVGYLPYYDAKAFDTAAGKYLTDLIYFSIEPTAAGDVDHGDIDPETLARLRTMRRRTELGSRSPSVGGAAPRLWEPWRWIKRSGGGLSPR